MSEATKEKTAKKKLSKKITIRLTDDDYTKFLSVFDSAKTSTYTQSDFIRDCILSTPPPVVEYVAPPTECDRERVRQLTGLTTNINQIARNLNILLKSPDVDKKKLLHYLEQIDTIATYCKNAMFEK